MARTHHSQGRRAHHRHHHSPVLVPPAPDDDAEVAEREDQIAGAIHHWRDALGSITTTETPIMPLAKDARVSSEYGPRVPPRPGASALHIGVDFVPADGSRQSDVVASLSGEVLFAGEWNHRMGNAVFIGGDDGNIYVYGHLSPESIAALNVGQRVTQGHVIGAMGNSGNTTAPDLHFEIRRPPIPDDTPPTQVAAQPAPSPVGSAISNMLGITPAQAAPAPTAPAEDSPLAIGNYFHDQPLLGGFHLLPNMHLAPGTVMGLETVTPDMADLVIDAPGGQQALIDPALTRSLAQVRQSAAASHPHHGLGHHRAPPAHAGHPRHRQHS